MASPILHIKDSFYFEVPRALWKKNYQSSREFYDAYGAWVIRNDAGYQDWEAAKLVDELKAIVKQPVQLDGLVDQWKHWQHAKAARHGRPLEQYLLDEMESLRLASGKWAKNQVGLESADVVESYLQLPQNANYPLKWMYEVIRDEQSHRQWQALVKKYQHGEVAGEYVQQPNLSWSKQQLDGYNKALSGKIFIPQPFATLRNAYQVQSGFGITRYMVVEVVVAILLFLAFRWLAGKISSGAAPKGRLANLLESTVLFVRDKVVVPAMGEHDADKYMPLLWTAFFFVLGCNLMGMIPWIGAPTSTFALTGAMALVVFGVGLVQGIRKFGVLGYLKNLAPSLGLPLYLAIFIVPLVYAIEGLSLFIKHGVLAVRLLANMVAGHLVLLGFMGIGFGAHAVAMSGGSWGLAAGISILASTLLSMLELFVACLQAYIFTFLSALFISSATHHH
ncbi:MAG: F0F1 ATP synthase subunit A [Pirellulaceae bacterium]|nr:F0F1 ATP synthase subunit A [Pirellulaceae bacterium]